MLFGFKSLFAIKQTHVYLVRSALVGIILIPIVGGAQGTFHSHAFNIEWWVFGMVNFFIISATALLTILLLKLFVGKKNKNQSV